MNQYTWRDLLAMPDDGVERWIVDGELKEMQPPLEGEARFRGRLESRALVLVGAELETWARGRPGPRGQVVADAGVILAARPETVVGIDLAYFPPEVIARQTAEIPLFVGIPLLAVMIPSPMDTMGRIAEKRHLCRAAGVPLIWSVEPLGQEVAIYTHGARPRMVTAGDELACEPHLPGFRVPVARLFE